MGLPPKEMQVDLFGIEISRQEIESRDTKPALAMLNELLDPDRCRQLRHSVAISVLGYDDDPRDLWRIPEVVEWIRLVDAEWPFWFYFISPERPDWLKVIIYCLCKTERVQGGTSVSPDELQRFLIDKIAQMNRICTHAADSQQTADEMSKLIVEVYTGDHQ